jgi:type III pantothenate kinase
MKPALVVDVGNSRIKWGLCRDSGPSVSLPPDDPIAWQQQIDAWKLTGRLDWAVSGVHPHRRDRLMEWIKERGDAVVLVDDWRSLPLPVRLDHPEKVGIDRLLNAVAVKERLRGSSSEGIPAVIVDAGSAVTVDWLDDSGAFSGGAIFPGVRLMAHALHDYTALLPLIEIAGPVPPLPGLSTPAAMQAGIFWAVAGGIRSVIKQLAARAPMFPALFLTGGDAALLQTALDPGFLLWPGMTLEGIRIAAEVQP